MISQAGRGLLICTSAASHCTLEVLKGCCNTSELTCGSKNSEGHLGQSRQRWSVSRPQLAFLKEGMLLAYKQVLGDEGRAADQEELKESDQP